MSRLRGRCSRDARNLSTLESFNRARSRLNICVIAIFVTPESALELEFVLIEQQALPAVRSLRESEPTQHPLPGIAEIWRNTLGDPSIVVAVLDGPVDLTHPSLRGAQLRVIRGVRGSACLDAACAHGTHVASLVFGQHGVGQLKGIAPRCRGIVIPVFSDDPAYPGAILPCSQADLARAIEAAVGYGARVINISAGQPGHARTADPRLVRAVELCARRGVLIVAAAGNDGCDCLHLPASLPSVLTVGAYQPDGAPSESSNFGSAYQRQGIVAPGLSVLGATPGGGYARRSGTSFAAPLVAGLAGLLLSARLARGGRFTARDARDIHDALLRSAAPCDLDDRRDCRRLLAGRVDPVKAFNLFLKGASEMENLANTPLAQAPHATAVNKMPEGVVPSGASGPGGSCGCGTPASDQADPDTEQDDEEQAQPSALRPSSRPMRASPDAVPRGLTPSSCSCQAAGGLVFAIGQISYDFGTQAVMDAIQSEMPGSLNASIPSDLLRFLKGDVQEEDGSETPDDQKETRRRRPSKPTGGGSRPASFAESPNLHFASAITWTLNLEATAMYALKPAGPFARETYVRLLECFEEQISSDDGINPNSERVSIPGMLGGNATLMSGQTVPAVVPDMRAIFNWNTGALITAVRFATLGKPPYKNTGAAEETDAGVRNFLNRIYHDLQNIGQTPQERALNFSATKAFQLGKVMSEMAGGKYELDEIGVERSAVCRPDSDCWDVRLTFFNVANPLASRKTSRFCVDVSGLIPVLVGDVRSWSMR